MIARKGSKPPPKPLPNDYVFLPCESYAHLHRVFWPMCREAGCENRAYMGIPDCDRCFVHCGLSLAEADQHTLCMIPRCDLETL